MTREERAASLRTVSAESIRNLIVSGYHKPCPEGKDKAQLIDLLIGIEFGRR